MNFKRKFFLIIYALAILPCNGQSPVFKNYNVKDGLASSEVYAVSQDSAGYLWFATEHGVSKFDGIEFQSFTTTDGLSDNSIIDVKIDSYSRIWFLPLTGLPVYYFQNKFHKIEIDQKFRNYSVYEINEDSNGVIWFSTKGGLIKISGNSKIAEYENIPELLNNQVQVSVIEKQKKLLLRTYNNHGSIWFYYSNKQITNRIILDRNSNFLNFIRRIPGDEQNQDYFTYLFGLKNNDMVLEDTILFNSFLQIVNFLTPEIPFRILKIDSNKIWLSTSENGMYAFDREFNKNRKYKKYLEGVVASYVFTDKENNMWITSIGKGVFMLPAQSGSVFNLSDGLYDNNIISIGGSKNKISLGFNHGKVNTIENKITGEFDFQNDGISALRIMDVLNHTNGSSWFATDDCIVQIENNKPRKYSGLISAMKCITEDKYGNILSGSYNSFYRFKNFQDDNYENLGEKYNLTPIRTTEIFVSKDSTIWLGTDRGLLSINNDSVIQYGEKNNLLSKRISSIREMDDGTLVIATNVFGVVLKNDTAIWNISKTEGLSGNICKTIFIDPDETNTFWVGTNLGLNKVTIEDFDKKLFSIRIYNSDNALSSDEVNGIYIYKDTIWVATSNGLTVFNKNASAFTPVPPPIYITNIRVNEHDTVLEANSMLDYKLNNLKFDFTGISYKSMGKITYRYKMIGLDSNWNYTAFPSAQYPSLPYGQNYTFQVSAKNIDGTWSERPAEISFSIGVPFWQALWFRGLSILAMVSVTAGFFRARFLSFKRREEEKSRLIKKVADMELKALRAQMNPHFTFNSLNSIQHFILKNEMEHAHKYLAKFSRLMRMILDNSKLPHISIGEELETLRVYLDLESLRFENQFEFIIDVDEEIDPVHFKIPSMLLQPFIENAIWHGLMHREGKRKLKLQMILRGEKIFCTIEDNGIGRKRSQELKSKNATKHHSLGMEVTNERIDVLNTLNETKFEVQIIDLEDERGVALGTRVELTIPKKVEYAVT